MSSTSMYSQKIGYKQPPVPARSSLLYLFLFVFFFNLYSVGIAIKKGQQMNIYRKTRLFIEKLDPFSELVGATLNTPFFLNSALQRLDKTIQVKKYEFSSEDVLMTIASGAWNRGDLDVTLCTKNLSNDLSRLQLSCSKIDFIETFRECEDYFIEKIIPIGLLANVENYYYCNFSFKQILNSLKAKFNLKHTQALDLTASTFGFDNGNDLSRFEKTLRHAMCIFQGAVSFVPHIDYFKSIKPRLDNAFLKGIPLAELNTYQCPLSFKMSFNETEVQNTFIPFIKQIINKQQDVIKSLKEDIGIEVSPLFDKLYQQLIFLRSGKILSIADSKEIVAQNLFLQIFHFAVIESYRSVYGTIEFRPTSKPKDISPEELQYRWIEFLVKGNKLILNESQKNSVRELQKMFDNKYNESRLSFPFMFKNMDDIEF